MGIYVNGSKYTSLDQIKKIFTSNYLLGWDDQWNEITEQLLKPQERIFEDVKFLEIELIRQQGLKEKFSDKYISDVYIKYIRREIVFYLEEVKDNLSRVDIQTRKKIVENVTQYFMGNPITYADFEMNVNDILSCFGKINIVVKPGMPKYIAETRVKQKDISPADIDIYRGYLPSMNYRWKEESFRDNIGKRIFTIVHELTHSVLGKLDNTKSASVNIFNSNTFILGDRVVKNNSVLINNADSWAISFFKIKDELMQIKEQQGQPEE